VIIFHAEDIAEMVETSRQKQITTAAYDSVGLCQMTDPSQEVMAKLVSSFYGWKWAQEDVADLGRTTLKKEIAFNRDAGLGPATDRLPDFFEEEALDPHEGTFRVPTGEIQKVLDL
jgi:aldehyde:ferredoxin oxidoreductase